MIFDYVIATPQETSRSMHRSSLKYDLSSHEEREEALVLLHRQQRQGDHVEFWMNIKVMREGKQVCHVFVLYGFNICTLVHILNVR